MEPRPAYRCLFFLPKMRLKRALSLESRVRCLFFWCEGNLQALWSLPLHMVLVDAKMGLNGIGGASQNGWSFFFCGFCPLLCVCVVLIHSSHELGYPFALIDAFSFKLAI